MAEIRQGDLEAASEILHQATVRGQVVAASLYVRQGAQEISRPFGASKSPDDMFLIASISKPMSAAAVMTLYDQGLFRLSDTLVQHIPEFRGGGRDEITIRQLLTHVSGLPDQLPENESLRRRQAPLSEFVERAARTPLLFEPGSRYGYSSMGILLIAEMAQRMTGTPFPQLVDEAIFQPLEMKRSALGLGKFELAKMMQCQVEHAAPESGAGSPESKAWDWNSTYWRNFAAPWGGVHSSAPDVGRFLGEFLHGSGRILQPQTARLMITNQNQPDFTPRGLGFASGPQTASSNCSRATFGHSGSTGTLAWADPATDTICVVLTTLPARAVDPHPRQLASDLVAQAVA